MAKLASFYPPSNSPSPPKRVFFSRGPVYCRASRCLHTITCTKQFFKKYNQPNESYRRSQITAKSFSGTGSSVLSRPCLFLASRGRNSVHAGHAPWPRWRGWWWLIIRGRVRKSGWYLKVAARKISLEWFRWRLAGHPDIIIDDGQKIFEDRKKNFCFDRWSLRAFICAPRLFNDSVGLTSCF